MRLLSKERVAGKLAEIRVSLRHAFATQPASRPLAMDDLVLLERIADAVVKRGMSAPATVFLESLGPMNFLGSQAVHFLMPILEFALDVTELEQTARLLERRDTIAQLISIIETKSTMKRTSAQ